MGKWGDAMTALLGLNTVQRLRRFLADNGMPQRPWTGASEVLGELEALLAARAEDPAFWVPLKKLLTALQAHARSLDCPYLPCPEAEILKAACLDDVIADLQAALPGRAEDQPHLALTRLAAPALCCVLLMAMAAGCKDRPSHQSLGPPPRPSPSPQAQQPKAEPPLEAGPEGVPEMVEVTPDVQEILARSVEDYVQDSNLRGLTKRRFLDCLAGFSSTEREDLVRLFQEKTPRQIARHLTAMARSERCRKDEPVEPVPKYKGVSFPGGLRPGKPGESVPMYKGVSFPDELKRRC